MERFWGKNAGEWAGRVEMSKEEIPGSKRSMHGYVLTHKQSGTSSHLEQSMSQKPINESS